MNIASIFRGFRSWRESGLATHKLARFSDRDLADIGLSRGDVDRGLTSDAERARRIDRYCRW